MAVTSSSSFDGESIMKALAKAEKEALEEVAKDVAEKLRSNVPKSLADSKHLKNNVVIGKADQYGDVKVGFSKEVSWRVHFVEFGTIYQKPQNFIENTEREIRDTVMQKVQEEITRRLGL